MHLQRDCTVKFNYTNMILASGSYDRESESGLAFAGGSLGFVHGFPSLFSKIWQKINDVIMI